MINTALQTALNNAGIKSSDAAKSAPKKQARKFYPTENKENREQRKPLSVFQEGRRLIYRTSFTPNSPFSFFVSGSLPRALKNSSIFQPLATAINRPHLNLTWRDNERTSINCKLSMLTRQSIKTSFGRFDGWENFMWYLVTGDQAMANMRTQAISKYTRSLLVSRTGVVAGAFYAVVAHEVWNFIQADAKLKAALIESDLPLDMYIEQQGQAGGDTTLMRVNGTEWWVALMEIIRDALKAGDPYVPSWLMFSPQSAWGFQAVAGMALPRDKAQAQAVMILYEERIIDEVAALKAQISCLDNTVVVKAPKEAKPEPKPKAMYPAPDAVKPLEPLFKMDKALDEHLAARARDVQAQLDAPVIMLSEQAEAEQVLADESEAETILVLDANLEQAPELHISAEDDQPADEEAAQGA